MSKNNELGKYLKKLRIDREQNMNDMATELDVSTAFLSAVETGKKNIPSRLVTKIYHEYEMSPDQKTTFLDAVAKTSDKVDIKMEKGADRRNAVVLSLMAEIDNLSDEDLEAIQKIIKKDQL